MVELDIAPKSPKQMARRMLEIEEEVIYSKEAQGEWEALAWSLGLEDRTPPWEEN